MSINYRGLAIYVPKEYISANKSIDLICNEWDLDPLQSDIEECPIPFEEHRKGFRFKGKTINNHRQYFEIETLPAISCFEKIGENTNGQTIYASKKFLEFINGFAPDTIGPYKRFKKANMIYYYRFHSIINEDHIKEMLENGVMPILPEPAPIETQRIHLRWLVEPVLGVPVQREPAETYTLREVHRWDRIMRGLQEPDES